jgi:hypothetical protein
MYTHHPVILYADFLRGLYTVSFSIDRTFIVSCSSPILSPTRIVYTHTHSFILTYSFVMVWLPAFNDIIPDLPAFYCRVCSSLLRPRRPNVCSAAGRNPSGFPLATLIPRIRVIWNACLEHSLSDRMFGLSPPTRGSPHRHSQKRNRGSGPRFAGSR